MASEAKAGMTLDQLGRALVKARKDVQTEQTSLWEAEQTLKRLEREMIAGLLEANPEYNVAHVVAGHVFTVRDASLGLLDVIPLVSTRKVKEGG